MPHTKFFKVILTAILLINLSFAQGDDWQENFPIKGEVRTRVDFWVKVYTEISTEEAFLHDSEDLGIIYKKVDLPASSRRRRRFLRNEERKYRKILYSMAKKKGKNLTSEEEKIKSVIGERSPRELSQMARNLRFQYGLKDRYYKGLIRSYRYMDYIKGVFEDMNMPLELRFLPHVESSFNYLAYSKVGAAGIWQFMRSTARLYRLKVGYVVDERRDVIKATKAAAKLLRDNYRTLQSWPLALTAYNHGARSMKRAINKLGTREIHKIIEGYRGRRFGFASKNFYATFMATVLISKEPEKYFKSFKKPTPFTYSTLKLPKPMTVKQLSRATGLSYNKIRDYNPSIRRSAFRSPLFLPKNFVFYFPQSDSQKIASYQKKLDQVEDKMKDLALERLHIVSRGESLYDISRGYKVSLSDLIAFNDIVNPSRIYAGMKIKIPGKDSKIETVKPKLAVTNPKLIPKEVKTEKPKIAAVKEEKPQPQIASLNKGAPLYGPALHELKGEQAPNLEGYQLELTPVRKGLYKIVIETEETLGHLAEWAAIRTQKIRDWNRLSYGSVIYQGQKLSMYLNDEQKTRFVQERNAYHLSIQEDFYENFKVKELKKYQVKRGDTLTEILEKFKLPYWLLRQSQEKGLSANLSVGQELAIPVIVSKSDESGLMLDNDEGDETSAD